MHILNYSYGSPSNPVVIMQVNCCVPYVHIFNSLLVRNVLLITACYQLFWHFPSVKPFIMSSLSNEGTQPHTNRHIFIVVKLYAICIYSHSVDLV